MRVLSVASEIFPLIKTGGLADVAGALPGALAPLGVEMRTLVPGYPAVLAGLEGEGGGAVDLAEAMGGPVRLLSGRAAGLDLLVLDAPHLYARPGNPYLGPDGRDWPDNYRRYGLLARVAADIGLGRIGDWRPDLVHGHDWQAGLAPAYLSFADAPRPATVLTIHNLAFQGLFDPACIDELGLPPEAFRVDGYESWGRVGFLKAGLFYADRLTTVSPTYAQEIQTEALGMGLHGLLRSRAADLVGIANGIDDTVWDPASDPNLPAGYDARRLKAAANRAAIQERFRLDPDPDALLCIVVSRLTAQKGLDLLLGALPDPARPWRAARGPGLRRSGARGRLARRGAGPSRPGGLRVRLRRAALPPAAGRRRRHPGARRASSPAASPSSTACATAPSRSWPASAGWRTR